MEKSHCVRILICILAKRFVQHEYDCILLHFCPAGSVIGNQFWPTCMYVHVFILWLYLPTRINAREHLTKYVERKGNVSGVLI